MADQVFTTVNNLIQNWQKTVIAVFIMILAFPALLAIYLLGQQGGQFTNVYQTEHAAIRADQVSLKELTIQTKQGVDALKNEVLINRGISADVSYFLQLTCVNTAKTTEQRTDCMKPKWQRQLAQGS